jgi:hypothetical protein
MLALSLEMYLEMEKRSLERAHMVLIIVPLPPKTLNAKARIQMMVLVSLPMKLFFQSHYLQIQIYAFSRPFTN